MAFILLNGGMKRKVLVIEDEPIIAEMICIILEMDRGAGTAVSGELPGTWLSTGGPISALQ